MVVLPSVLTRAVMSTVELQSFSLNELESLTTTT